MPKARRQPSIQQHAASARPASRLAAFDAAKSQESDRIEKSDMIGASADEILASISKDATEGADVPKVSKKDKQRIKHDAFLQRLEATSSPYARLTKGKKTKPKAGESLTKGMKEINAALDGILDASTTDAADGEAKPQPKRIGHTSKTITAAQKKHILAEERKRIALVRQHPVFVANPFATIQALARTKLEEHQRP